MPPSLDPTPEELATVVQLRASLREFAAATTEVAARHQLTTRQYDLCLLVASGQGSLIGRAVADALHLSANTASELITRAELEGLVKRSNSTSDTRLKPLSLTAEGRRRFLATFNDLRPERTRLLAILQESVTLATRLL
jgi:DNA-binding MarR family transcriptional regulator